MTTEEATRKGWFGYYKCLTYTGTTVLVVGIVLTVLFMTFAWLFIGGLVYGALIAIASKLGDGGTKGGSSVDRGR